MNEHLLSLIEWAEEYWQSLVMEHEHGCQDYDSEQRSQELIDALRGDIDAAKAALAHQGEDE